MASACTASAARHGGTPPGLRPVMSVRSEVIAVREIGRGEPLGYGGRFVAGGPTRVGLVAFGYADGYPRSAGDGTPVAVDRRTVPLIGRVAIRCRSSGLSCMFGSFPQARLDRQRDS